MQIDPSRIFESLDPMEQDFVEAEAKAMGLSIEEVVIELVREGLACECIDEAFQATDRQWKSH